MVGLIGGGPEQPKGVSGVPLHKGDTGNDGKDAYELAVMEGFSGTREQWIASLKGEKGDKGDPGPATLSIGPVNTLAGAGMWVETFPDGDFTIWIEDGV